MRRLTAILLSCLLVPAFVRGQAESAPSAGTRPANKAQEIAARIEKQVEKLRGIKMQQPVKVGVYDRETLKAFLLKTAEKELTPERIGPQVRAYVLLELVPKDFDYKKTLLEILNEQIGGFYDPDTKELRLIDRSAASPESSDGKLDQYIKKQLDAIGVDMDSVTMAHELTHALQDQLIGLKTLPLEVEDDDDLARASLSVVEGDASVAMLAWAMAKQGVPAKTLFSPMMAGLLGSVGDLAAIPGADAVQNAPEYIKRGLIFAYEDGMKFCIAIGAKDGFAAIDRALKDPPLSTEQIIHPKKYAGEKRDHPTSIALPDLAEILGLAKLGSNTLGEFGTRILLGEKLPASKTAAEGWDGDRFVVYGRQGAPDALVWLSTWDSPADADEIEAALREWLAPLHAGKASEASDVTSARYVRADGTLDAIARKGQDVMLLRGIPKEKLIPVLQKLFEETKKEERRKV
jgi:hypothetical protein